MRGLGFGGWGGFGVGLGLGGLEGREGNGDFQGLQRTGGSEALESCRGKMPVQTRLRSKEADLEARTIST